MSDIDVDRWRMAVIQCHGFKELMSIVDLNGLIAAGGMAQTIGPIFDPTKYRDKGDALECDMAILRAAAVFVGAIDAALVVARKRAGPKTLADAVREARGGDAPPPDKQEFA